jgi:hypothetical protein
MRSGSHILMLSNKTKGKMQSATLKQIVEAVKPEIAELILSDKSVQKAWHDDILLRAAEHDNSETYEISALESKTGNPVDIDISAEFVKLRLTKDGEQENGNFNIGIFNEENEEVGLIAVDVSGGLETIDWVFIQKEYAYLQERLSDLVLEVSEGEFSFERAKNEAAVSLGKQGGKASAKAREGKTDYSELAKKRWSK